MDYCIINFGGFNGTSAVNTADAFKVSSEGIEKLNAQTLDSVRAYSAAASVGNCILAVGGGTASTSVGNLDVFRFSGSKLEVETNVIGGITSGRNFLAAASLKDYVFAMGGCIEEGGQVFDTVDVFEVTLSDVKKVSNHGLALSTARGRLAAATAGNRVIAVGGIAADKQASKVLDSFRLTENGGFERLSVPVALSEPRYDLAAAYVGNYVLAMGGNTGSNASNAVDVFKVNENGIGIVVAHGLALSVARYGLAAASVGNYVLAMGGYTDDNVASDVVDVFEISNGKYKIVTDHGLSLKQARAYLSAATAGNYVLAMGGQNGSSGYSKAVDVFFNYG